MGGLVVPLSGQVGPARASTGRRRPVLARQCRLPRLQEPQRSLGLSAWRLRRYSLSIKNATSIDSNGEGDALRKV